MPLPMFLNPFETMPSQTPCAAPAEEVVNDHSSDNVELAHSEFQSQSPTSFHLIQQGTRRGKTKLVTSNGYSFNIKRTHPNGTIYWQCTVRPKKNRCRASVLQWDGKFIQGQHQHNHLGRFSVEAIASSKNSPE